MTPTPPPASLEPCPNPWHGDYPQYTLCPGSQEKGYRRLCICGMEGPWSPTPHGADAAWNRRPSTEQDVRAYRTAFENCVAWADKQAGKLEASVYHIEEDDFYEGPWLQRDLLALAAKPTAPEVSAPAVAQEGGLREAALEAEVAALKESIKGKEAIIYALLTKGESK